MPKRKLQKPPVKRYRKYQAYEDVAGKEMPKKTSVRKSKAVTKRVLPSVKKQVAKEVSKALVRYKAPKSIPEERVLMPGKWQGADIVMNDITDFAPAVTGNDPMQTDGLVNMDKAVVPVLESHIPKGNSIGTDTRGINPIQGFDEKQNFNYNFEGSTPFAHIGQAAGSMIGSWFGWTKSGEIGRLLGHSIGRLFGSGDYHCNVLPKQKDTLMRVSKSKARSKSSKGGSVRTNIISHREYIGDVSVTGPGFSVFNFPVQPGNSTTFPWLSTIAANYEQYRMHGIIFEFKSNYSDGVTTPAVGSVIMSTDYNVDAGVYPNKVSMENAEYSTSAKPSRSQMHGLECKGSQNVLNEYYTSAGGVKPGGVNKFYDFANFQLGVQGIPGSGVAGTTYPVNIGELWVTYVVEFIKPQVPATIGGNLGSVHTFRNGVTGPFPLGNVPMSTSGSLNPLITTNSISFANFTLGNTYQLTVQWYGVASAFTAPTVSYTGTTPVTILGAPSPLTADTLAAQYSPFPTVSTQTATYIGFFKVISTAAGAVFSTGAGLPGPTCVVDIIITQVDNSVTV